MQGIPQDHRPLTQSRCDRFIADLDRGISIVTAAGDESTRRKLYRLRAKDPDFARRWDNAFDTAIRDRKVASVTVRRGSRERLGIVYFIGAHNPKLDLPVKIGWTGFDPSGRLAECQRGSPVTLRVIGTLAGPRSLEREMHRRFRAQRIHGEWFEIAHRDVLALLH